MRRGSITTNIFLFSIAWLVIALAATAFLLTNLYSRALDTSLVETIEFHIQTLVGQALTDGLQALPDASLGDPRFTRPASGWYWEVRMASGESVAFSPSLIGTSLPKIETSAESGSAVVDSAVDSFGTQMRVVQRQITLAGSDYVFTVTGNLDEIYQLVAGFRGQTIVVLSAVGVMLAIMSALVARFALRPVIRLRNALERVREGDAERVEGDFPAELEPLSAEVNELLRSNSQIIDRARSHVGNLAHGLKTPIAVLQNEAEGKSDPLSAIVRDQAKKMSELVSTYLDRASLSARTAVVGRKANTGEVLTRLVRVMSKIHKECQVELTSVNLSIPWFRGEESDLEEMLGNLIDNACKWATRNVVVSARPMSDVANELLIVIEDDGRGLSEEQREQVLRRGVRLDEKKPGSGLGLDIVKELVDVYGGSLQLTRSEMGGLKVSLTLPASRPRQE